MGTLQTWARRVRSILRGGMQYLLGARGHRRVDGMRLFYGVRTHVVLQSRRIGTLVSRVVRRDVRLFIDGKKAFRRIERLMRKAKSSVVIQMFIWKDDVTGRRMAQVIVDTANRGVIVDITKDAVGDFFEKGRDFLETKFADSPLWKSFWNHKNIRIRHENGHDHAKVYVIDDHTLVLTGMNIADEYRYRLHDYMVELRGKTYVEQFLTAASPRHGESVGLLMNRGGRRDIRPYVMHLLGSARRSIVVEHCYVGDAQIIEALIRRSHDGVRITMILPTGLELHHYANMQSVGRLLAEGKQSNIQILFYPRVFHAKVLMVDRSIAFLGSANLMASSLDRMGEVNVSIGPGNMDLLNLLRESLQEDILKSRPLVGAPSMRWLTQWLAAIGL